MSEDSKLWILGMFLGAALLGALGYAMHLSGVRDDAARLECIKQGRIWLPGSSLTCAGGKP